MRAGRRARARQTKVNNFDDRVLASLDIDSARSETEKRNRDTARKRETICRISRAAQRALIADVSVSSGQSTVFEV